MATAGKRKRGRPKSTTAGQFGPLTIRVSHKVRFALELLAQGEGLSLSQTLERLLTRSLYREKVNHTNLGDLVDNAWEGSIAHRLCTVYAEEPLLLAPRERAWAGFVEHSAEMTQAREEFHAVFSGHVDPNSKPAQDAIARWRLRQHLFRVYAAHHWDKVTAAADEVDRTGAPVDGLYLAHVGNLPAPRTLAHLEKVARELARAQPK